jgi:hypothetical protein
MARSSVPRPSSPVALIEKLAGRLDRSAPRFASGFSS